MYVIIVLSGHICSGKSTLARGLAERFNGTVIATHDVVAALTSSSPERQSLQIAGNMLDDETRGRWLATHILSLTAKAGGDKIYIIDAARSQRQIKAIREIGHSSVTHIHLTARRSALVERFDSRGRTAFKEAASFKDAAGDATEAVVDELDSVANLSVDTTSASAADVLQQISRMLVTAGRLGSK